MSGVVFDVKQQAARREVGGRTLFFCCESCANYFSENQATVVAARGMQISPRPAATGGD